MLEFLRSRAFFKHLVIAVISVVAVLFGTFKWISSYTMHGETIVVPDLSGLNTAVMQDKIEELGLRVVIVDSIYDKTKKKGTVIDQDPTPGFKVKQNRTIYVTLSSFNPSKVQMPNLEDVSLRQATAMLETYGLQVGKLTYIPDFAKNAVIRQLYKGNVIKPGELIVKESKIDLVLGDGLKADKVSLPNLVGLTRREAVARLNSASLNVGSVVLDASVKDSAMARVYKQVPEYSPGHTLSAGKPIDIFLTQDESKLQRDTTSQKVP